MLDMTPLPMALSQIYKPSQQDIYNYWIGKIYNRIVLNMLTIYFMPYYITVLGITPVQFSSGSFFLYSETLVSSTV